MKKNYLFLFLFAWITIDGVLAADLIGVTSPAYCSEIQGNTTIQIAAPNHTAVRVHCWKQGTENKGQGTYTLLGTVTLDEHGAGSIVFPADEYPHGPLTIRISSSSNRDNTRDCYLQLYNKGGVSWKEGLPPDPPAAAGMKLIFADDFDAPLSIGPDPAIHRYYDHKPPNGSEDFSYTRFTSFNSVNNPFKQVDTYLRIRANERANSAGIISSVFSNNTGISASVPCYFECRFVGPNAPGTWPAFWLLTKKDDINNRNEVCDELDIIEAYGYMSEGNKQVYRIAAHPWGQPQEVQNIIAGFYEGPGRVDMYKFGILSTWFDVPHTYGCKITEDYTIYYCDDIEVARHKTLPISKSKPHYFLINLGTGGGWDVNLSRYNGIVDMYVDYVRVYAGTATDIPSTGQSDVDVEVYPNPVDSGMTIALNLSDPAGIFVNIYNALGQQVSSYQQFQQGDVKIPVDMSNMSNGVYLAKINVGEIQVNKKIIKQ